MHGTTAGAAGALIALIGVCLGSFPFEMPGTLALGGLALGLVAFDPNAMSRRANPRGLAYAGVVAGALLVVGAALRAERSLRTSWWLGAGERSMHTDGGSSEALRELQLALNATPSDLRARLRMAQVLLREHQPLESADSARHALATEPYSPNAWAALAAAELDQGKPAEARQDATEALTLLQDFPFALQLRIRAAEQEGDLAAAQADRQRLTTLATSSADRDTASAASKLLQGSK
jgi:tetratricopeptide (TPR) repeat protein